MTSRQPYTSVTRSVAIVLHGWRPERRELGLEPLSVDLEESLRARYVLQITIAEVDQPDIQELVVLDDTSGRLRQDDLTPVGGRADPCGPTHADADIPI